LENCSKIHTFRLRIAIKGSVPLIWRLIEVPDNISLEKLHHVVQIGFGWDNTEDFEFTAFGYTISNHNYNEKNTDIPSKELLIRDIFTDVREKIYYNYNLFNNWIHAIRLEAIVPFSNKNCICLSGKNSIPLEESGNISGHNNLVRAFFSTDSILRQQLDFVSEDFNPLYFNLLETNERLAKIENYIRSWERIRIKA